MNKLNYIKGLFCILFLAVASLCQAQFFPPTPLAGKTNTDEYIRQNLHYPEQMLKDGQNGKVVVSFTVDEKGVGKNYQVTESFCPEADAEVLKLVKRIEWLPATQELNRVSSEMQYPVEYHAKTYRRYWKNHERIEVPLTLAADTGYRIYDLHALEETAKPYFADGGTMAQYILDNLEFPEAAKAAEISGKVRLSFVVETDGGISNIVIVNSVGGGCDNEAIRLLQGTRWIPAVKNGEYVRSRNFQDITFNIGARNYIDNGNY